MNRKTGILLILTLAMTGCGIFDDDDDSATPQPQPDPPGALSLLSALADNDEPGSIGDSTALKANINALFGEANGDPIAIQQGDTVEAIIKRAGDS